MYTSFTLVWKFANCIIIRLRFPLWQLVLLAALFCLGYVVGYFTRDVTQSKRIRDVWLDTYCIIYIISPWSNNRCVYTYTCACTCNLYYMFKHALSKISPSLSKLCTLYSAVFSPDISECAGTLMIAMSNIHL